MLPMVASPLAEMVPTWAISAEELDFLGALLDVLDHGGDRDIDAALEIHRVHAGGNRLGAFPHDCLRQHRCRCCAVASHIIGLLGNFTNHLRAHVLELVLQLDFLCDRHAVFGDAWRAV